MTHIPKTLVKAVAQRCQLSQDAARSILTVAMEEIDAQSKTEKGLVFREFGTFFNRKVKGRRYVLNGVEQHTQDREELAFRASRPA